MNTFESFTQQLYTVNGSSFNNIALSLFAHQAAHNPVYKAFIQNLGITVSQVATLEQIPFLPISMFKRHVLKTGAWKEETIFTSSGTTGATTSTHYIKDVNFYLKHAQRCFEHFFGSLKNYHFLALLPSYLERSHSSLIAMMEHFIKESDSPYSGFYLHNTDQMLKDIKSIRDNRKIILWGVSFALLDLAEKIQPDLSKCMVFETGGMKGRRKEIVRAELHEVLKKGLNTGNIYSEYGMTELLSQSYLCNEKPFQCPPWMKISGRDISDPLHRGILNETAGINVIDLANWYSIAFIETEDLGKVMPDGTFDILGRLDNTDIRGCNLLAEK